MPSSSVEPGSGDVPSSPAVDERLVSSLRTQAELDSLCKKHGIPRAYAPRLAGDGRRACTPPPPGSICVYADALEAGMRVPLHGFFCEVLTHFGIAPAQLMPNGWRVMAGFLALCRTVGVPPCLRVFRRFFVLSIVSHKQKGWYCIRARDPSGGLRFTGMPNTPMDWKKLFFFLSSPEPWPCPVEWGEPSRVSFLEPVLIGEEKNSEAKLLAAYGAGATIDITACMCGGNLAGATAMVTAACPPLAAASPSTCVTSGSKAMDPSVYDMMKTMLAEKAAAAAQAEPEPEPGSNAPKSPSLCGNKRSLAEANDKDCAPPSMLNTALSSGVCSPPPGFSRKPLHFPSRHAGDGTDWKAARDLLQSAIAPAQARAFAASERSDVVKSSYAALLQAVKYTSFSLSYALELEEKLVARDVEVAALREQLEEAEAELAAVKRVPEAKPEKANVELAAAKRPTAEAELEKTKRGSAEAAAVQHVLGSESEEHVRRRAAQALEKYDRWRGSSRGAAPRT